MNPVQHGWMLFRTCLLYTSSLTENLDTTTPSGEFLFQVFGALAQYERALIQERVVAGLAAARKRGRIGGRPQAITGEKLEAIVAALDGGTVSYTHLPASMNSEVPMTKTARASM